MNDSPGLFRRTPKIAQRDERRTYPVSYGSNEEQQDQDPSKYLRSAEDRDKTQNRERDMEANRSRNDENDDDVKEKMVVDLNLIELTTKIKCGDKEIPLSQLLSEAREKYGTREGEVQVQHLNYTARLKQQTGQKTLKHLVVRKKAEKVKMNCE